MKKLAVIIVSVICLISCTKEGTRTITPVTPVTPPPTSAAAFTWKENGVTYTADSAWFYTTTRIAAHAGAGANKRIMTISFPATTTGVFPIPPSFLGYSIGGSSSPAVTATSGTLTITTYDNTNNLLSGTFTNVTVGSNTLTDGTFTNLPKR